MKNRQPDKEESRLTALHRETGGQAMLFVAITLFVLVCFFALVMNVGNRANTKVQMQNASDAAALSGGIWYARGLNLISIMNVGMTECLALIIMFKAFEKTAKTAKIAHPINLAVASALCAFPFTSAVGCPWQTALNFIKPIITAYDKAGKKLGKLAKKPNGFLWKLMDRLHKVERAVQYAIPVMAALETNHIAKLNGADSRPFTIPVLKIDLFEYYGILHPAGAPMPTESGTFKDLCPPLKDGGPGYDNFLCWDSALGMKVPFINMELQTFFRLAWIPGNIMLPPTNLMWEIYMEVVTNSFCGGSSSKTYDNYTDSCKVCSDNGSRPKWAVGRYQVSQPGCSVTPPLDDIDVNTLYESKWPDNLCGLTGDCDEFYPQRPRRFTPSHQMEDNPCRLCVSWTVTRREPCIRSSSDPTCKKEVVPPPAPNNGWKLVNYYYRDEARIDECKYTSTADEGEHKDEEPAPLVLEDDWEKRSRYAAVVFKNARDMLSLGPFKLGGDLEFKGADNRTWSLAQVKVYNATHPDLFNQDWHAMLTPVTRETLSSTYSTTISPLPPGVEELMDEGALEEVMVH